MTPAPQAPPHSLARLASGRRHTRWARRLGASIVVALVAALVPALTPVGASPTSGPDPTGGPRDGETTYVVTLAPDAAKTTLDTIADLPIDGDDVVAVYEEVLTGFAAELSPAEVAALAGDPRVDAIEVDQPVAVAANVQLSAPWGLDRLDQDDLPLNGRFEYPQDPGAGVRTYVVDTGVRSTHVDFNGRVASGHSVFSNSASTEDCHGHGTHVAGTLAGTRWGVAKAATIVPVRVLDCAGSGYSSGVASGLDWIALNHPAGLPGVVNLSLGGPTSGHLDTAISRVADKGLVVVVAAGNSSADACGFSPSRSPRAITVGSTTSTDARSSFSNTGSCVDLFAPGSGIRSATPWNDSSAGTMSGTSMAAPHVAGIAAVHLAEPGATSAGVRARILNDATANVSDPGAGSPTLLARLVTAQVGSDDPATEPVVDPGSAPGASPESTPEPEPAPPAPEPPASEPPASPAPIPVRCGFSDVPANAFYAQATCWLKANNITTGYGNPNQFAPQAPVDRAQMAAFLHRAAGSPPAPTRCGFSDVPANAFYAQATCWLKANNITTGYGNPNRFAPQAPVDRAQMAAFLFRANGPR